MKFIHFIYIKLNDKIAIWKDILIERGVANPLTITRIPMNILIKAKSLKTKTNVRSCTIIYIRTRLYRYDLLIWTYMTGEKHIFKWILYEKTSILVYTYRIYIVT